MLRFREKVISGRRRLQQILSFNYALNDEEQDYSVYFMFNHVPYKQVKQAQLEAELRIAEAYAWYWRLKIRMI